MLVVLENGYLFFIVVFIRFMVCILFSCCSYFYFIIDCLFVMKVVLDVGCGIGIFFMFVVKVGVSYVIGID